MCRVELITGVHSRLSEFWNSLISEWTINVYASACICTGFPVLPGLFSSRDLTEFEANRAVPYVISDAGCSGNVCG